MKRISITSTQYIFLLALFFTIPGNLGLWKKIFDISLKAGDISCFFYLSFFFSLFLLMCAFLCIVVIPYMHRVLIGALLFLNGLTTYAIYNFGTLMNRGMMENVFSTKKTEILSYISINLLWWLFFLSALPFLVTLFIRVDFKKQFLKSAFLRISAIFICFILLYSQHLIFAQNYSFLGSENPTLMYEINPISYIVSVLKFFQHKRNTSFKFQQIGLDAIDLHPNNTKKNVLVLIVGETSRSMEYSLNGYERNTNPLLSKESVVSFYNFHSCGAATAVSVPCMFSNLTQKKYDANRAKSTEGLLDVLNHAGLNVLWKDNDAGCKGTCNRVSNQNVAEVNNIAYCHSGSCYDGIFLEGMTSLIQKDKRDQVIVLHLIGSHGPNYYQRYPKGFELFKPVCNERDIQNCDHQALVNTYDNTIVYTDYIIASIINILKNQKNVNASLIYLSDHGESLGENGVYLHGLPYFIAPKEQTTVPFIVWLSSDTIQSEKIDMNCLKRESRAGIYSQDNLFSSVLGLMEIKTSVYNPDLDIFQMCKVPKR